MYGLSNGTNTLSELEGRCCYEWQNASRGPSASAELLYCKFTAECHGEKNFKSVRIWQTCKGWLAMEFRLISQFLFYTPLFRRVVCWCKIRLSCCNMWTFCL